MGFLSLFLKIAGRLDHSTAGPAGTISPVWILDGSNLSDPVQVPYYYTTDQPYQVSRQKAEGWLSRPRALALTQPAGVERGRCSSGRMR